MAAVFGQITEFDESKEEWPLYAERLEQYFAANGVDDAARQRAILLSVIGARTYRTLRSLVAPLKPKEKSVDEILQTLTEHFDPKPSVIVQRLRFNSRSRQEGESVAKFTVELQRLSEHRKFGAVLSDMLRDRLVVGIMSDRIQQRLLAEKELTFKRAYDLAIAHETAEKNTTELQQKEASSAPGNPEGESVHQLQKQPVHQLQRQ